MMQQICSIPEYAVDVAHSATSYIYAHSATVLHHISTHIVLHTQEYYAVDMHIQEYCYISIREYAVEYAVDISNDDVSVSTAYSRILTQEYCYISIPTA